MMLLSTRTRANDVSKHKIKGQKRLRSIGTITIEVVEHTNKGK